ncbi:MAG: hypothetical protein D6826_00245, partial [Alphaproteobacteria bacterium]
TVHAAWHDSLSLQPPLPDPAIAGAAENAGAAGDTQTPPAPRQNGATAPCSGNEVAVNGTVCAMDTGVRRPGPGAGDGAGSEARSETPARPNRLVPTNAVHTTKRRLRRNIRRSQIGVVIALGAIAALVLINSGREPSLPDIAPLERPAGFERQIAARPDAPFTDSDTGSEPSSGMGSDMDRHMSSDGDDSPVAAVPDDPVTAAPPPSREIPPASADSPAPASPDDGKLAAPQLAEIEELLARLELNPGASDGIIDARTTQAIRTYQEIAGLPINGTPSSALLDDLREVVQILEGGN